MVQLYLEPEESGYYYSIDDVPASTAFVSSPPSLLGLVGSNGTGSAGGSPPAYELGGGVAAQTGAVLTLDAFYSTAAVFCLSVNATGAASDCVSPLGSATERLNLTVGPLLYSFPRGALVLSQRSPLGVPTFWLAFTLQDLDYDSSTTMLPYPTPVSLLLWDDSPADNSLVPNANLAIYVYYVHPTTNATITITSLTYPTRWTPVLLHLNLSNLLTPSTLAYYWDESSAPLPARRGVPGVSDAGRQRLPRRG